MTSVPYVPSVVRDFDEPQRTQRNTQEDQEQSWLKRKFKEPAR